MSLLVSVLGVMTGARLLRHSHNLCALCEILSSLILQIHFRLLNARAAGVQRVYIKMPRIMICVPMQKVSVVTCKCDSASSIISPTLPPDA